MEESRLCVILDRAILSGERIFKVAAAALAGGAAMIQLRDKLSATPDIVGTARRLKTIVHHWGALLIVNDSIEAAMASGADGLHIGQGDMPVRLARSFLGRDKLIGASVADCKEAFFAKREGADYVGVGPVFRTPIKRGMVGRSGLGRFATVGLPVYAIGGIGPENIKKLADFCLERAAVIRSVCCARNPRLATERLVNCLGRR